MAKLKNTYSYRGAEYLVKGESQRDTERLIQDFKYCESIKDYTTIKNRIINGTTWGWLEKL